MNTNEFGCPKECVYASKAWPKSKGKPTCRLFKEYDETTNPVTKAVLRQIIRTRLGYMGEERPVPCEKPHVERED